MLVSICGAAVRRMVHERQAVLSTRASQEADGHGGILAQAAAGLPFSPLVRACLLLCMHTGRHAVAAAANGAASSCALQGGRARGPHPSSGVRPMLVSTLRPARMAAMLAPAPRCAMMRFRSPASRPSSRSACAPHARRTWPRTCAGESCRYAGFVVRRG